MTEMKRLAVDTILDYANAIVKRWSFLSTHIGLFKNETNRVATLRLHIEKVASN